MVSCFQFFGCNKVIKIDKTSDISQLEQLLNGPESVSVWNETVNLSKSLITHELARVSYEMTEITSVAISEYDEKIVIFSHQDWEIPTLIAIYSNDEPLKARVLDWLKNTQEAIIWPLLFNTSTMIQVTDRLLNKDNFVTVKLLFNTIGKTENDNIRTITIELEKESCSQLYNNELQERRAKDTGVDLENNNILPLTDCILPHIHDQSGIIVDKMPLTMINLMNEARITKEGLQQDTDTTPEPEALAFILFRLQSLCEL